MLLKTLTLSSLLSLSAAHFTLDWPKARGFDDEKAGNFPCGGFDTVSSSRTDWPISGGPVQLRMEHTQTNVEVLLAIGSDPGSNYNIVLRPQLAQEGPGNFCLGQLSIPSGLNVSDGTLATIQVVSNGDPSGGLFQCADVTLRTSTLSESDYNSHCNNGTGVKVNQENIQGNPNETTDASPSPSASGSGAAASGKPQGGLAAHQTVATWLMGAVGAAAFALL